MKYAHDLMTPMERRSPEYQRGVRQLAAWHLKCALQRLRAAREARFAEGGRA